jgi:hypothetical protein
MMLETIRMHCIAANRSPVPQAGNHQTRPSPSTQISNALEYATTTPNAITID